MMKDKKCNFLTFYCFFSRNVRQTWITSVRHGTPKWISSPQNGPFWKCWTLYFSGLQSGPFHVQPMSHTTQSLLAQQFYNLLQKVMNQKNTNMKGNLLRGIDNCSGIWYKGLRLPWTTSFSDNFSFISTSEKQTILRSILAVYGFHSENNFWECNFEPLCCLIKMCY